MSREDELLRRITRLERLVSALYQSDVSLAIGALTASGAATVNSLNVGSATGATTGQVKASAKIFGGFNWPEETQSVAGISTGASGIKLAAPGAGKAIIRLTGAASTDPYDINGIGAGAEGDMIVVLSYEPGARKMRFVAEYDGATNNIRSAITGGTKVTVNGNMGGALLVYSQSRWSIIAATPGSTIS